MNLFGTVLAAVLLALVLSWTTHHLLSFRESRRFPPPGRLVDVGGRNLHIDASGEGSPIVVLDSALAGTSLSFREVQSRVAQFTRVVSTDRAGFGWSDPAASPRRADILVEELRRALRAAMLEPPYVLVGHSYGGLVVRLFAATYPREVSGLVLVDAPHPREWMAPSPDQARRISRGARLSRGAAFLAHFGLTRLLFRLAGRGLILGGSASGEQGRIESLLGKVPPPLKETLRSFWVRPATLFALASLIENVPTSAALVDRASGDLGALPLRVLTAADPSPERLRDQEEQTKASSRGRHLVSRRSGHFIPLDEPELVVDAIRAVVEETGKDAASDFSRRPPELSKRT